MEHTILDAVQSLGIDGEERGDEYIAPCPAHAARTGHPDHDPSWSINLTKGVHHCFSCHWSGNFASLLVFMVGEKEAKKWGTNLSVLEVEARPEKMKEYARVIQHVEKNKYLRPDSFQGIPEAALATFGDPPEWALKKRDVSAEACRDMGALWDTREDRWALIMRDSTSRILGWQYKTDKGPKRFAHYPTGMSKGSVLFGYHFIKDQLEDAHSLVVVESPLDAVRLWDNDIPAVAVCGTYMSKEQLALLRESWVTIVPDNDVAGGVMGVQARTSLDKLFIFDWEGFPDEISDPGDLEMSVFTERLSIAKSNILLQLESYQV